MTRDELREEYKKEGNILLEYIDNSSIKYIEWLEANLLLAIEKLQKSDIEKELEQLENDEKIFQTIFRRGYFDS